MGFKKGARRPRQANWQNITRENQKWEDYYKALNLIPEEEFPAFKAACQQDLPLTFRITGSTEHAQQVREMMESNYIDQLKGIEWDGQILPAPAPLPFYPNKLGWQVKLAKQIIRRNPQFKQFQRFLVVETSIGNISRQETVSMIPPLFLDVQPHHIVLDTCASPGSKTTQLIEALHAKGTPTGVVIANDSDNKRAHMLTHQVKRLNSPNVIVINHDAQMLPNITIDKQVVKFDRILCDVPCSGDATMRKNVNVWKDWRTGNGLGLHKLQLNIASRGVQMLKAGGRLVYSTCSLNPIENEAVVAQLLRQFPELKLVDVSDQIPELKRRPGVSSWKVQDKNSNWVEKNLSDLDDSLFAPEDAEVADLKLERCMRVYPHQQDSGGFFIAVLEKEEDEEPKAKKQKVEIKAVEPVVGDGAEEDPTASAKLPRDAVTDPFSFLPSDNEVLQQCWDFYGLHDFNRDSFVVRNQTGEPVRSIYYVAPNVRSIILENDERIKFVYAGLKTFNLQKNDKDCAWRIQSEAIAMLYPHATKRILKSDNLEALKFLIEDGNPKVDDIIAFDSALGESVKAMTEGCCFLDVQGHISPLWRGKWSVNVMLPKEAKEELLLRIFGVVQEKPRDIRAKAEAEAAAKAEPEEAKDVKTEGETTVEPETEAETAGETTAEPEAQPEAEIKPEEATA